MCACVLHVDTSATHPKFNSPHVHAIIHSIPIECLLCVGLGRMGVGVHQRIGAVAVVCAESSAWPVMACSTHWPILVAGTVSTCTDPPLSSEGGNCWRHITPYDGSLANLHALVGRDDHMVDVDGWTMAVLCSCLHVGVCITEGGAPTTRTLKHPCSTPSPALQWHSHAPSQLLRIHIMDMYQKTNT